MKRILFVLLTLIFLFTPSIFAKSIQVDYPSSVKVNEEFSLNLKLIDFPEDVYDVKIDINPKERIAKIYNKSIWKSTIFYINNIISISNSSNEENFKLKIIKDFQGVAPLEIKIKSSKESIIFFANYTINIDGVNEKESIPKEKSQEENISNDANNIQEEIILKEENKNNIIESSPENTLITGEEVKTIILNSNPKDIKSETDKEQLNKNKLAIYGIITFCILLTFLFMLKKRKNKNEFE